jgi:hypothetical protein
MQEQQKPSSPFATLVVIVALFIGAALVYRVVEVLWIWSWSEWMQ